MSLWVKVHTNFYTHRKTAKLRALLGNDAFWIPPRLWAYAAENQPDGDFSAYSAAELAALIGYNGDPDKMLQALLQADFLDGGPKIHDWGEYGSVHVSYAKKAKKAALARWERVKKSPAPPKEETETEIETSQALLGTEPSIASSIRDIELKTELPPAFPRTAADARRHAAFVGCPEDFAETVWHKAMSRGGCDAKGLPVRSWRHYLKTEYEYRKDSERRAEIRVGNGARIDRAAGTTNAGISTQYEGLGKVV